MRHLLTDPPSGSRVAAHLRSAMCAGVTALCLIQAWAIVFVLRIGPVVAVVDARQGHGVHLGDSLALLPLLVAATVCGMVWVRTSTHQRRTLALVSHRVALR